MGRLAMQFLKDTRTKISHVIVDIHLSHLGGHLIPLLGLHLLPILLLLVGLAHVRNAGGLNEVRELERRLLNAALALEVLALLGPVPGDRDRIPVSLTRWEDSQVSMRNRVRSIGTSKCDPVIPRDTI